MHILKIIHGYPPHYNAGSEVYSQSICNELSKTHRVSVFTREENPYRPDFEIRKVAEHERLDIYLVNNPQGKDGYRHAEMDERFAELLHALKPDVAHVGHVNHLSTGLIDVLHAQRIPIVFTLHDFWLVCPRGQFLTRGIGRENKLELCSGQEDGKCARQCYQVYFSGRPGEEEKDLAQWSDWIHRRMQETKALMDKVNLFIAPSHYLRERFICDFGVAPEKIIYLDYGFPLEYLTPTLSPNPREVFTFGYIGTQIPAKGVNHLIEAFSKIEKPAALKIFGRHNGQSSEALKKLAQASLNPIEFPGEYVNRNLANEVFRNVDCIVVPSIWAENSPLVIHEAQACKIPVITADFGGMKEYVQHKVNGLLFEHRNPDSLREQMEWAIAHQDEMQVLGKKGYLYSQDGAVPDIRDHCGELEKIYKSLNPSVGLWRITIDTNPEDCNLACIMCEEHSPYSDFKEKLYKKTGVKVRRMPAEWLERIFREAKELGVKEIIPSTMGEPLLYKNFDRFLELCAETGIKCNLTTNGTFPKRTVGDWARRIVPVTSDVKISWNGATAETSQEVMRGINFEQTVENVRTFIRARDEIAASGGNFCRVTFQLTFMRNNMHELADIIRLAASLGVDRVKGHQLWDHFEEIKSLSFRQNKDTIAEWNRYVAEAYEAAEHFRKPNGEKVLLEQITPLTKGESGQVPEEYECPFLGKELWISATGTISPCCAPDELRQSLGDFGNYQEQTIGEVMGSENYLKLVRNYKSQELCRGCNMRKPKRMEVKNENI